MEEFRKKLSSLNKLLSKLNLKEPMDPETPVHPDKVRFVVISDSHNRHPDKLPEGDVFLHAGDFTGMGSKREVNKFNDWLETINFKHKVVIAGNHEIIFDPETSRPSVDPFEMITNATYLHDSEVTIMGIKIYGAPWQPEHCLMAFNLPRGKELRDKWTLIPNDTDILMTHGPPEGILDRVNTGQHVGCADLLKAVQKRVKPKFHVFGHIHEDYGMLGDGTTTYINAAILDTDYQPANSAIVFDFPLPPGVTKDV